MVRLIFQIVRAGSLSKWRTFFKTFQIDSSPDYQNGELFSSYQNGEYFFIKMANFFKFIKMANFCVIKKANFFYQNGELFLSKWRISFYAYSQNGEFFAVVMKCLKGLTQKSRLFAQIQNSRLLHSKKVHFSPKSIFSGPVAVPEPNQK